VPAAQGLCFVFTTLRLCMIEGGAVSERCARMPVILHIYSVSHIICFFYWPKMSGSYRAKCTLELLTFHAGAASLTGEQDRRPPRAGG